MSHIHNYSSIEDEDLHDLYRNSDYHIQNRSTKRRFNWMPTSCFGLNEVDETEGKKRLTRLLDRDGAFDQSRGRMHIRKRIRKEEWRALYGADLFHSLVDAPTVKCIVILLAFYNAVVFAFSVIYFYLSYFYDCNLGIINYGEAFIFSLETMATIGYGTQDIFFNDCWTVGLALMLQVSIKLVADAVTIGVIYCRLSRPTRRASTVLFSNQAVIRRIRGKLYLMLQLCELRKHQLSEAHVRLYTIRRDRDYETGATTHFQTCSMRLNHPDDELGSMLLLCLPQVVVHEINGWSPLMPPPQWRSANGSEEWEPSEDVSGGGVEVGFPSVLQRPTGTPSATPGSPIRCSRAPPSSSSSSSSARTRRDPPAPAAHDQAQILRYMQDRRVEILVIVEGIDAATGGTVQARHSYTTEDIVWNHTFPPCVREDHDGAALIDFSLFHHIEPVGCTPDAPGTFPSVS